MPPSPSVNFETVPAEPKSTIWEGALAPRPDLERDAARGLFDRRLEPEDLDADLRVVTIGEPEVLRSLGPNETPGYQDLVAKDFYLLRLWCSFHDFGTDLEISRAHFKLALHSRDGTGVRIVARDMYPLQVLHKVKRDVRVALTPEIKFAEVGASLGTLEYGFAYTKLEPTIFAAGHGESTPSWTFARTKSQRLQGGKAMHLVVAAPEGAAQAEADIELIAHVTKPGLIPLPMGLFEKRGEAPPAKLKVGLW
jgi:hypothetical protein